MPGTEQFWRDRQVLVTGASGLVGSWLVEELVERRAAVVALVRDHVARSNLARLGLDRRIDLVRGALEDRDTLERALGEYEVRTVVHLGAQTIVGIANRNPVSTFEANVRGTWNLLEACRRSPLVEQIVVASSDKAYGDQVQLPYTEEARLEGRHPYDVSKSCADLIATSYHATYRSPVCITRCGNFYGGGDLNWNRIVPGTIRSILRGERPVIRSDGSYVRDYFYVKDGTHAILTLVEAMAARPDLAGHAFNFSNEIQVTVLELVSRIGRIMQSDLEPLIMGEARSEIVHQYLSAAKARKLLEWSPRWNLDRGLEETIAWYRDFFASE